MKIAYLLYGQPRNYKDGYENIKNLFKENNINRVDVDFFFHCWLINENEKYNVSPWRKIENKFIVYNKDIINDLIKLYKPKAYEFENQKNFDYKNIKNSNNILSQMYSRNKVKNLFNLYNMTYDFVIMSRFDNIYVIPSINLNKINTEKIYRHE